MTNDERRAKMAELKAQVKTSIPAYNELVQGGKYADAVKADEAMKQLVNEYTNVAREVCFNECLEAEDPMVEACHRLRYTTIGVKDTKQGEEKIPVREFVDDREKVIDLVKLDKKSMNGIGHNKEWNHLIEALNLQLTVKTAMDLHAALKNNRKAVKKETVSLEDYLKDISDSYAMSKAARDIDLGKNPCSNTQMLKTLTKIVQAMIGEEYKPTSHDVNFLKNVYAKKGKSALTVVCATHKYLREYVQEICHRLIIDGDYNTQFKEKKE